MLRPTPLRPVGRNSERAKSQSHQLFTRVPCLRDFSLVAILWQSGLAIRSRARTISGNAAPLNRLGLLPIEACKPEIRKKSLDPGIGSTLYNPWSDPHEFRKEFLSFR